MEMTPELREALGWALDRAHDDLNSYMTYGTPSQDYGQEWPDAARMQAGYCRQIAQMAEDAGLCDEERWMGMAESLEESATQAEEEAEPAQETTLENVEAYLERQTDLAYLAYRRFSEDRSEMPVSSRSVVSGDLYNWWIGVGDAREIVREILKGTPQQGATAR